MRPQDASATSLALDGACLTELAAARHLYLHVPFCGRRCSYCDFAIAVRRSVPVLEYTDAIEAELSRRLRGLPILDLDTLYLGGGTPSKLGATGVVELVDRLIHTGLVSLSSTAEVTMEANPEDVSAASVAAWGSAGVNRISLGAQSFHAPTLAWMHRTHEAHAIEAAVETARAGGISDISLDLIFAVPQELGRDWRSDLDRSIALAPSHLSVYGLTIEPHTPLGKWTARGDVEEAPEDEYAAQFLEAHGALTAAGFEHYEVSNYALGGRRSRHNSAYWRRVPYIGLGPSAHSYDGARRSWNEREYEAWRERLRRGESPQAGDELLAPDMIEAEDAYLGLRTSSGVALTAGLGPTVQIWVENGWGTVLDGRVRLTPEGWLRLDALAAALTSDPSR